MITSSISYSSGSMMVSSLYKEDFEALSIARKNNANLKFAGVNKCNMFTMEEEVTKADDYNKSSIYFPELFQAIVQVAPKSNAKSAEAKCLAFIEDIEFRILQI